MKEKLSQEKKAALLENGREVYSAYSLLDMATNAYYSSNDSFLIDGKKQTFRDYVSSLILQNPNQKNIVANFVMGSAPYKIQLIQKEDGSWDIVIPAEAESSSTTDIRIPPGLKKIHEYTSKDFISFCQKYPLTLHQDEHQKFSLSTFAQIKDKKITFGGKDKIELYQIHLVNLEKMLTHIGSDNLNLNMLVDMATGSGKSFTQALWFLLLYLSDISCTFAVPRKDLVRQLAKDFQRVLPKEITRQIKINDTNEDIDGEDEKNNQLDQTPSWKITTHENLLKEDWRADVRENSWVCFDEEHEASASELFKKRINELGKHCPLLFLSATPSENAYALCRDKGAMISFSRRQKIESKIAQPITAYTVKPKDIIKTAIENSADRPNLLLDIGETPSSAAHAYVDRCDSTVIFCEKDNPFYRPPKPEDSEEDRLRTLRWNVRSPLGEKALIHARQPDTLINFFNVTQGAGFWKFTAYKNGREVNRYATASPALSINDLQQMNCKYSTVYENSQVAFRKNAFCNYIYDSYSHLRRDDYWINRKIEEQIDFSPHYKYLQYRVLHGLIETTLKYLTGYTSAQLDSKRFNDLPGLVKEVQDRIKQRIETPTAPKENYYENLGQIRQYLIDDKIPQSIAEKIAPLMFEIARRIDGSSSDKTKSERIVDNWALDKKLHDDFLHDKSGGINDQFKRFVQEHSSVFFVNGLDDTAHAIQSDRPFNALDSRRYSSNSEEVKNNPALQQLVNKDGNTLFASNHSIEVFHPRYLSDEYSPEVVDNLYKNGLIGAYVTSERVSGFNDPDLHHVAILIEDNDEGLNDPTQTTQGAGRLRTLNPGASDFFFLSVDRQVVPSLPAESLDDPNFYPLFFEAKKNYHKKLIHTMGKNIAEEMETWINSAVQPNGKIDIKALETECKKAIFEQFETLYNQCNHDFDKTKQAFLIVLEDTYKTLYQNSQVLQNFYSRKFDQPLMKAYVFVVNLIGGLWYKLKTAGFYLSFITTKWTEADKEKGKNVGEAKKNLATWIERKKAENLKINVHEKYIAWAMSKIKASKTLPKTGPNIFTKEVILGSRFSDTISKVDLRLEGEIEPENLIEQWITKLKDHCAKNNIPKNEMKTVKTHLEHWVNQNTSINFTQEFTTWQESNSGNRRKTMDDFLKEEIFGNANVSCHFNEEYSVDSLGKMSVDSVGENLKRMIELQNPANFDNENTYKYIIRNYDYRDLISGMTKLGVFMQSVFDEISKADNKESEMTEDVIKNISRYFKISLFAKEVSAIMDHLPDSHLLTILNTIYPNDRLNSETDSEKNDSEDQSDAMKLEAGQPNHLLDTETDSKKESVNNEQKIAQLRQFVRDCNRLSPKEFVRKYLIQRANSNRSDNCIAWFGTVFAEIKDCLCYYHRIDEQGGLDKASSPQLKRGRGHNIWDVDPYKSQIQDDSFMGRYLRMWNASAKLDAVSSLDEVHQIKSTHTISALENVADNFIKPLRSYFSGNFFDEAARSIKSMQNLAPSEKTVFSLAKDLGERLVEAKPLTQEDILSPDTDHLNAVQKLRATFSRS